MKVRNRISSLSSYQIAVALSTASMALGILRELLILGFLGLSHFNDELQLYLSIFYTVGLSIDAMRLSCLNLYSILSMTRILISASIIALPFAIGVSALMSYSTQGLNSHLLIITTLGSYLNLIAALLITYKQRNNHFLSAQIINVIPNFILIPGWLFSYYYLPNHIILTMVCLTSLIPVCQCIALLFIPTIVTPAQTNISYAKSLTIITRHFMALVGEQLFQVIVRAAFFRYGTGYLSLYAITIRIYAAARFILIDSFIGSKLANWENVIHFKSDWLTRFVSNTLLGIVLVFIALVISIENSSELIKSAAQMCAILLIGFYFATLVRIIYFKINRQHINSNLVLTFASFEIFCAFMTFLLTRQLNYPILALLWIGYIAKPFAQLILLRKTFLGLQMDG